MSKEAINRLSDALVAKIDYFRKEYNLTYGEVIGILECIKLSMWNETNEDEETF